MQEAMNWYIDNNRYLDESFLKKIIGFCDEASGSDESLNRIVLKHEPNVGNPGSQLSFARDMGIIDSDSKLTDMSILYKAGVIDYPDFTLSVFSKRNVSKKEDIPIKPLVLLSKVFTSFVKNEVPETELFLTASECKKYLSVLSTYDEYTDEIAKAIVDERIYSNSMVHLPDRPGDTPVQWTEIYNLLDSTVLFKLFYGTKDIISADFDYIELISHIATVGESISIAPISIGRDNVPLCSYYSKIETGIMEIIPEIPLKNDGVPSNLTRDLFNYIFGVDTGTKFPWGLYMTKACFGIYRIFFPIRKLVLSKIYSQFQTVGEHLFDYLAQAGKYTSMTKEGKLVIIPPFAHGHHTDIKDLTNQIVFNTELSSVYKRNRIVFGAPGTGKSFTVNEDREDLLGDDRDTNYERVTFHPEYTYANFVGAYKPIPAKNGEGVTYEFVPGPFMRIYVKALKSARCGEQKPFLLVIEEINRADVAAVFGDIFQLLDRGDDNVSEYPVQASEEIKDYLSKPEVLGGIPDDYNFIKIPDNMFIWATMNSADQGVFPMDTAFKRRWEFSYIGINEGEKKIENCIVNICGKIISWNKLRKAINDQMISNGVNEDKLLGPFFLPLSVLPKSKPKDEDFEKENEAFLSSFQNKVIMYLFSDAVKHKLSTVFSSGENNSVNIRQYSSICEAFKKNGVGIFVSNISSRDLSCDRQSK